MSLAREARMLEAVPAPTLRTTEARIEAANRWIIEARPIIRAMFALEDVNGDLASAKIDARGDRKWSAPETAGERTYAEAQRYVSSAFEELKDMLDGIRDNYVADETISYPAPDQETADQINDRINDETISVKRAIEMAVAEYNAGGFK